nr:hypothetical protein [Sphingopyxis sp.]
AATLLTPLDMGSHILQHTHHAVVATGHHRNNAIMATVISTFIGPVDDAQARARSTGAQLIVICPEAREFGNFRTAAGDTLAKRLYAGDPPAWLTPVPVGGGGALRVWRIDPPANMQ